MKFELGAEQVKKFEEWRVTRPKKYSGAAGGRYTFSFTPTGLGESVTVTDYFGGDKLDLTDYDNW